MILSGEEQFDEQILLYFDGSTQRQTLDNETEPTVSQAEIDALDIRVLENRENEMVFTISINDYIRSYNSYYERGYCRSYLTPASQWQCYTYDSARGLVRLGEYGIVICCYHADACASRHPTA